MQAYSSILRVWVLVVIGMLFAPAYLHAQLRPKKLIQTGHDMPTAQQLRRDLLIMERSPFQGLIIEIPADNVAPGVNGCPFREMLANTPWERAWFTRSIADLLAIHPTRLTDIFINTNGNPGNVDWFDDEGWANIIEHFRLAAWVACQGRLKGILFDAEPYVKPYKQFAYQAQPYRASYSFSEYVAKARQRGREVMQAITAEYPDITIFTYFMNSYMVRWDPWLGPAASGLRDPYHVLAAYPYGLYAAFIDGWLDVAPLSVTFVDGDERAYEYKEPSQFWKAVMEIKGPAQEIVSPENRRKYRDQVQASAGIYLDAYLGPQHRYWLEGNQEDRALLLERNVTAALQSVDEYVWIYGETGRWWPEPGELAPWKDRRVGPLWIDLIPEIDTALRNAQYPDATARRALRERLVILKQQGAIQNLSRNGTFTHGPNNTSQSAPTASPDWTHTTTPAEWSSWQDEFSTGVMGWDSTVGCQMPGAGRLSNVSSGCLIQTYSVMPGERYFISIMANRSGEGLPTLSVGWKTPVGVWLGNDVLAERFILHPEVYFPESEASDDWKMLEIVVTTPERAGQMIVMPGVSSQASPRDVVWFDELCVYRIPPDYK